jgi:oligopeptidase B
MENTTDKIYPLADRRPHLVHFGRVDGEDRGDNIMEGDDCIKTQDPFFWLRSDDRTDPDVLEYLHRENDYTSYKMFTDSRDNELFEQIKGELNSLIKDDESIKILIGDQEKSNYYRYYSKTVSGQSHKIHYLELTDKKTHQVTNYMLLDENSYKNSSNMCSIHTVRISYSHKYLLFGLDTIGNNEFNTYMYNIEDITNRVVVEHRLPTVNMWNFDISRNEKFIFYTMNNSLGRKDSLFVYDMDTHTSKKMLYKHDPVYSVSFELTDDGSFLLVDVSSYKTNNIYYADLSSLDFSLLEDSDLSPHLKLIQENEKDDKYRVKKIGDYFVILTNKLGNTDFIPMYCKIGEDTSEKKWKMMNTAKLEMKLGKKGDDYLYYSNMYVSKDYITYNIRHNGITKLVSVKFNPVNDTYPFSDSWIVMSPYEDTGVVSVYNNDYASNNIIVKYSSLTTPIVYMKCNINNKNFNMETLRICDVPTYNRDKYVSSRVYAISHDGEKVPISIVHLKDLDISNGPHKLHLYGYGSYGVTIESEFNKDIIPLLNRGYIYAIAHIRGGGFMGFRWYESGKMMNKMNTFLDFKSVAEYLVDNKYTTSSLMSCEGWSAGGLLAGYCIAKLPHIFNSVIACVPFVDVLTTMCDPTIPLTTEEWEQWGNPNNRDFYDYMKGYSPYDNIQDGVDYPHFYVTGGLTDSLVQYWEPAKFVAKLRYAHNSLTRRLQVLDMNMNDGHFGSSDMYQCATAKRHLFLLKSVS